MSQESKDYEQVEESDEETNVFVVDPEEYQQTKKLQSIHKARERVRQVRSDDPGVATENEWEGYHARLARAVADYASEMMVLIEEGIEKGVLDESDLIVETPKGAIHIREFVTFDGADTINLSKGDKPKSAKSGISMAIYRQLDRILNDLGLGLEFGEDKGPAQI
jgi:hypothetical protein